MDARRNRDECHLVLARSEALFNVPSHRSHSSNSSHAHVAPATSASQIAISVLQVASVGLRRCTSIVCSSSGWRLCAVVHLHEKNTELKVERENECRNAPLKYRSAAQLCRLITRSLASSCSTVTSEMMNPRPVQRRTMARRWMLPVRRKSTNRRKPKLT